MDQQSGLIGVLENENEMLRQELFNIDYNVAVLYKRLDTLQQKSLVNYVEIFGVPEFENEDCFKIVEQIGFDLGVQLSIINAERLHSDVPTARNNIVAQISTYEQKKQLMYNLKNQLIAERANGYVGGRRIYINDFLTDFNRILLYKTKQFAKENGFKYAWYNNCKILLRKSEQSTIFLIRNEFDLVLANYSE